MFSKLSEQIKKSAQPAASLFEMNAKTLELMSKRQTELFSGVVDDGVKLLSVLSDRTELTDVLAAQSVYAESVRERLTSVSRVAYSELNGLRADITDLVKNSLENVSEEAKAAFVNAQPTALSSDAKAPVSTKAPAKKAAPKKAVAPSAKAAAPVKPAQKKAVAKKPVVEAAPKTAVKAPVAKAAVVKAPVVKAAVVKAPVVKAPVVKAAVAKAPVAKAPAAKKAAPVAAPKTVAKVAPKATVQAAPKVVMTESQVNEKTAPAAKSVAKLTPADVKAAGKK